MATVVLALLLAGASLRWVGGALTQVDRQPPATGIGGLTDYLKPLPEGGDLAPLDPGTMVVTRDPFAPQQSSGGRGVSQATRSATRPTTDTEQRWVVSSILLEGNRRSAIVNNAWVTVGDPVGGGARLTAVEPNHVVITDANGNRHVVPIRGGEV